MTIRRFLKKVINSGPLKFSITVVLWDFVYIISCTAAYSIFNERSNWVLLEGLGIMIGSIAAVFGLSYAWTKIIEWWEEE